MFEWIDDILPRVATLLAVTAMLVIGSLLIISLTVSVFDIVEKTDDCVQTNER